MNKKKTKKAKKTKTTPPSVEDIRRKCIERIERQKGCKLVRREPRKKTIYENKNKKITVVCLYSKEHEKKNINDAGFWFTFHSNHKDNLLIYNNGYLGLGCGTEKTIILIPKRKFINLLDGLPSINQRGLDYFLRIEKMNGKFFIDTRQDVRYIPVQNYLI